MLLNKYTEIKKLIKEIYRASKILYDETIPYLKPGKSTVDIEDIPDSKEYFKRTFKSYKDIECVRTYCKIFNLDYNKLHHIASEYHLTEEKEPIDEFIDRFEYIKNLKNDCKN